MVHAQLPEDGEVTGLLALMLLTHARRAARTTAAGDLVPLDEQDRAQWDRGADRRGHRSWSRRRWPARRWGPTSCRPPSPPRTPTRPRPRETNWPQVHALYLILERIAPNPMVTLNRAIALAETDGPAGRAGPAVHAGR